MLKLYLILGLAGLIVASGIVWKIQNWGYDRCENRYEKAAEAHEDASNVAVENIRQRGEEREKNAYATPELDRPVGPVLERVLDGLRTRHGRAD